MSVTPEASSWRISFPLNRSCLYVDLLPFRTDCTTGRRFVANRTIAAERKKSASRPAHQVFVDQCFFFDDSLLLKSAEGGLSIIGGLLRRCIFTVWACHAFAYCTTVPGTVQYFGSSHLLASATSDITVLRAHLCL